MQLNYPLRFKPVFRSYIWGGRRLQTELRKSLPDDGNDYAESWEVVDHGEDQSVVVNGPLQGFSLARLVQEHGEDLLGKHHPRERFPLLFKFLDCQRDLSVQVHPTDEQAAQLVPPDLGKTEAWVILSAEQGARLYAGLHANVDRATLEAAIRSGRLENCLHQIEARVGDCFFIPAGTVHALAAGLVVAEIQQSSNTTFRLFDWNRVRADGKPRELHIEQGLAVVDFQRGPVKPTISKNMGSVDRLVNCDKFVLDRHSIRSAQRIGGDNTCHILAVIDGDIELNGSSMSKAETILLPAAHGPVEVRPASKAILLDMYLP